jgi:sigma-B regulation protein RsbU (phosphoserine phosphatase)
MLGEDRAGAVVVWGLLGTLTLGLASLASNFVDAPDEQARRKTRVMFWGTVAALTPNVLLVGLSNLLGYREPDWLTAVRAAFAFLLPLSIAYAVVKHRVLEVPVLIRRGARYLLVQRGFTVLLALISIALTIAFARWVGPALAPIVEVAGPSGVAAGAALGMLLLWGGSVVHRQVGDRIDRAFFRQAYDARAVLQDLANKAAMVTDRVELAGLLRRHVTEALHPTASAVYLRDHDDQLKLMAGGWPSAPDTLPEAWPWLDGDSGAPTNVVATSHGPDHVVPIAGRDGRAWGVMALGPRRSEEPYSREDADLLDVVASQTALALENLSLAEQMATRLESERRHLHELSIARDVQQMLLPQRMPPLATLDYAGACTQARVVGGDYYDFLDLGSGRVAFVLADISGKGIAASLLMANLQAIVRSHSSLAATDHEAVLRSVNDLFRDSTGPNRFATMFFAVYDDATRGLSYVNCGHNPPLLVTGGGSVKWLAPTAVALGFLGDWQCATGSRVLSPGDVLVAYSDGITEAWSPDDEEYGEERLLSVVRGHRDVSAKDLAGRVVADVKRFSRPEQSDDWTLIVARSRTDPGA